MWLRNQRLINIGIACLVGSLIWFIWQASTKTPPELQSTLARFFLSKLLFGQSSAAETFFNGSGRDISRTTNPIIYLPISMLGVIVFSSLKTLPRFLLWLVISIFLTVSSVVIFETQHLIIPYGGPMILLTFAYVSGTLLFLESEKIMRGRALAIDLQTQAEEERKRIAKDLHDEALPSLSRVMRLADDLHEQYQDNPLPLEIRSRLESTVGEMRRVINDLHPAVLENLGLAAALQHLVDKLSIEGKIQTNFQDRSAACKLPPFQSLCVYRIAQEALNNVEKHAEATQMCLSLEKNEDTLLMKISDNGKGKVEFKPESHGLKNMKDRANLLGAKIEWTKSLEFDKGTSVILTLPLAGLRNGKDEIPREDPD